MPLRTLARFLANDGKLVERLANSYMIRRLAQLTHYTFIKGTQASKKSLDKFTKTNEPQQPQQVSGSQSTFIAARVMRQFYKNIQKEIERKNIK